MTGLVAASALSLRSTHPPVSRSATIPVEDQSDADVLDARVQAWRTRPLLRRIYHGFFADMLSHCALTPGRMGPARYGRVVEIGGGSGNFREFFPAAIVTDFVPTRHVHLAADAMRLPFAAGSIDNLVMQDVLHHLPHPLRFLSEAQRVLRPGGRCVMTEPYISPVSRLGFALTHPEPVRMRVPLVGTGPHDDPPGFTETGPWASNQAIPTLLFRRDLSRVLARLPDMTLVCRRLHSMLVYPLSGGFSGPQLIPTWLVNPALALEAFLQPLAPLLAFRMTVVLERT